MKVKPWAWRNSALAGNGFTCVTVAEYLEAKIQKHQHREECLEAEIRRLRQCLRTLSEAVIAGEDTAFFFAREVKELLEEV